MGVVYNAVVKISKVCTGGKRVWHKFNAPSVTPSLSAIPSTPSTSISATPSSSLIVPSVTPSTTPSEEVPVVIIPTPFPSPTPSISKVVKVKKKSFWDRLKERISRWFR